MTQEQLDTLTEMWVMCMECSTNGFRLISGKALGSETVVVSVEHDNINSIVLPYDNIKPNQEPRDIAEKVFELLDLIYKYGDQWLQDEADYHGDKLAEKWDNDYKNNLEND